MLAGVLAVSVLGGPTRGAAGDGRHAPLTLKSTSIDLPTDAGLLPDGPGADAANGNCLGCHSAEMVLTQPALPRAVWEAEVRKMIGVFKAPIATADVPALVDYLVRIKGAG